MTTSSRPAGGDDGRPAGGDDGRPAGVDDGYSFGDITAATIVASSVLSPLPSDPTAQRRSAQVEAGRREALARVAAEAAEIGLESAGQLAAAAGVAPRTPPRPAAVGPRRTEASTGRVGRRPAVPGRVPARQAPPLAGPPAPRRGQAGLGDRVVRSTAVGGRPVPPSAGRPTTAVVPARSGRGPVAPAGRPARPGSSRARPGVVRPRERRRVDRSDTPRSGRPLVALLLLAVLAVLLVRALLR